MSIKEEAKIYVDELAEDATWNDLVKNLMRHKKITLGMTDIEVAQDQLSEAELSAIMARLQSSSSRPDDMRDTRTYQPDNSLTASWVMVAFAPLLFISLLLAPAAYILSGLGILLGARAMVKGVKSAWLPTFLGVVELVLFVAIPVLSGSGFHFS